MNDNTQNTDKKYKLPQSPDARKRRFIAGVGLAAAATVFGSGIAVGASDGARQMIEQVTSNPSEHFSTQTVDYLVQPGDALFTIADQIDGIEKINDKRIAVEYIKEINNLSDSNLQPGQKLAIPVSFDTNL